MTEYQINAQAALEIKLLHQKIGELRELDLGHVMASLQQVRRVLQRAHPEQRSGKSTGLGA